MGCTSYTETSPALYVLEVTDPAAPALAGSVALPGWYFQDITASAEYAYVALDSVLHVVAIAEPADPTPVAALPFSESVTALEALGEMVFAAHPGGLSVVDVTDPAMPNEVAYLSLDYPHALAVTGHYLLVKAAQDLVVFDVAAQPPVAVRDIPLVGYGAMAVEGDRAFLEAEGGGTGWSLAVIDVSHPEEASIVAEHHGDGGAGLMTVSDGFLYTGWTIDGAGGGCSGFGVYEVTAGDVSDRIVGSRSECLQLVASGDALYGVDYSGVITAYKKQTPRVVTGAGVSWHQSGGQLMERVAPNPFAVGTTLRFAQEVAGLARVEVFDVSGRIVRRLVSAWMDVGEHAVTWDGRGEGGLPVGSGTYFCRIAVPGKEETRKMTLRR